MTLLDAVSIRFTQRDFLPQPLSPAQQNQLAKAVGQCNRRSGLHIQLICGLSAPVSDPSGGQGWPRGARCCLAFAGPAGDADLEEKCGYWGEELVLTAAAMGLGSCWMGGDKASLLPCPAPGEELVCAAAVGPLCGTPPARRTRRPLQELAAAPDQAPPWFAAGISAVQLAPSSMNRQGYRFLLRPDGSVQARLAGGGSFALVDLGIAKYHFELGAHGGTWTWGDGGIFHKAAEEKSCGAVIWRDREDGRQYLLARHNGGHWSFPKGHMEGAETEEETAAREIWEETGLRADIDTAFRRQVTYYPAPGVVKDVVFFIASPSGGTERRQEAEIAQLGWFPFQEARALVTYATDEEILLAADAYLQAAQ